MSRPKLHFDTIAGLAALIPLIAGNAAYLISASAEIVPWCFPDLDGCTSISRAARHGVANVVDRGMRLPYALLMVVYWLLVATWIRRLAPHHRRTPPSLRALGIVSSIFMALYLVFLGVDGEAYQWMRRYGIVVYFGTTVLAEIILTRALATQAGISPGLRRTFVLFCAALIGLGLACIPLKYVVQGDDILFNAIEWNYSLLMLLFFPLTGVAWRQVAK